MRKLIIATRGSKLALVQAEQVREKLKDTGCEAEILVVKTKGDRDRKSALKDIGGSGLFVKEIELTLQNGDADIAVHSGKDLPYELIDELVIAGNTEAADCRDCLLTVKGRALGNEPVIGTGSPRRICECQRHYPDAQFRNIRGNVETRIRKLADGEYDAIVIAKAGLDRLGVNLEGFDVRVFEADEFMPAACQGILGIECRSDDKEVLSALKKISDEKSRIRFNLERQIFCGMQADCSMAVGAHAEIDGDRVALSAMFDGRRLSIETDIAGVQAAIDTILKEI